MRTFTTVLTCIFTNAVTHGFTPAEVGIFMVGQWCSVMGKFYGDDISVGSGKIKFRAGNAVRSPYWRQTALIVDADPQIEVFAHALELRNRRVFLVDTIPDAIAIAVTYTTNIIIVNDSADGLDAGITACREINRVLGFSHAPVLMMTATVRTQEMLAVFGADYGSVFDRAARGRRLMCQYVQLVKMAEQILRSNAVQLSLPLDWVAALDVPYRDCE